MITLKKIKIHYSLIIYIILCGFTGFIKDGLLILSILLIHELSHILAITLFKGKVNRVDLTLIGGLMDVTLHSQSKIKTLIVDSVRPS